jgi:hypothetical protein
MSWVLIAVFGFVAWLSAVVFVLTLCRAAARADALGQATVVGHPNVIDLAAVRENRRPAMPYFKSRDSRLSFSSLPSVWQVGQ